MGALFLLSSVAYAHGISAEDKQAMLDGGNLRYIWLGATHMLTGYDHLLFLFGVVFFLKTVKDIVTFVTIFTIGHSITLILATFMGINANYWKTAAVIGCLGYLLDVTGLDSIFTGGEGEGDECLDSGDGDE